MLNLVSADLIHVDGKPIFTFKGVKGLNPRELRDEQVMIDGQVYDVLSVETFAVIDATGFGFGLMVKRAS